MKSAMDSNEGQFHNSRENLIYVFINTCSASFMSKNNLFLVTYAANYLLFLIAAYSILKNGLCLSEMNNLLRISSENAWKLNSIPKHIWPSLKKKKKITFLSDSYSCLFLLHVKFPENTMLFFLPLPPRLKSCFPPPFWQKVFLGCEFAAFAWWPKGLIQSQLGRSLGKGNS